MLLHKQSLGVQGLLPGDGVSKLGPSRSPDAAAGGCSPAPAPGPPVPQRCLRWREGVQDSR